MSRDIVFTRTAMGQDIYDLIQLIKHIPIKRGPKRDAAIDHIAEVCEIFKELHGRDPFDLLTVLTEDS